MVAVKKLLLVLQAVAVSLAFTRLPRPDTLPEALTVNHGLLDAILKSVDHYNCSVFLVRDDNTSVTTLYKDVGELEALHGVATFEVAVDGQEANVTQERLSKIVDGARRLRQVLSCVTVVVLSDDPVFLAAFVNESFKKGLLVWPTRLLVVTRQEFGKLQDLETSFSMTNSMLLVLQGSSESPRCTIYIHQPYSTQKAQALWVAHWTPQQGLSFKSEVTLFPDKFYRFSERPTLVLAAEEFPNQRAIMVKDPEAPGGERLSFTGPMSDVIMYLAEGANFSYTYVRPPDRAWGTKQPDGSWSGMVGLVIREKVDIALGPFATTVSRSKVVDFSWPVRIDDWRILGSRGRPEVDPWGFLLPLSPLVWAVLLTVLVLLSVTTFLLSPDFNKSKILNKSQWSADFFCYIRIMLQQDIFMSSDWWWWERLLLAVWLLMTLVLTRSYAGNLMSLLAVRHIPQPYQSLRDVLDDPSVAMIWQKNSMLSYYIQSAESGIYSEVRHLNKVGRLMYRGLSEFPLVAHTLVRAGDHALVDVHVNLRIFMAEDVSRIGRCDFYVSRENVLAFPFVMIFRKHSPLGPALVTRIMRLHETGLGVYWLEKSFRNFTACQHAPKKYTVTSSLSLTNLWGMFVVIGAGLAASLHVFMLEIFISLVLQSWCSSTQDVNETNLVLDK